MRALQPPDRGVSGPKPTDVILDAGTDYRGQRGPSAKPGGYTKHVVMRVDRGDGFVGRNFLMRGGLEFGFYTEETDGVLLDKTKFYWNADYGHLSFTSDHHVVKNCDGFGSGDAAVYPGAAPETGSQADQELLSRRTAGEHRDQAVRPARLRARILGIDGQRRAHHQQPHLRQRHGHRHRHPLGRRPPGLPGRQRRDRQQPHLREQLQPLHEELAREAADHGSSGHGDHLRGHERRPRARQLDLRQLA